ncbi:CheR family methyltransferase [Pinirhizobacter sp.]|jgi:two-component system CheB/CheR fusion protein|uniref:CheR family methyltransferase n=1 Tax=Pinirhizobacter sp. TaxID=2950432 RepID=UPI002F3FE4ED
MSHTPAKPSATVVIGIGASAGGVEALQAFFASDKGIVDAGYLVVLHMQKARPSRLVEILARKTSMPVVHAEDGMTVAPGRVHVIEPGSVMTVADGRLVVTVAPKTERSPTTIDRLFNSLAQDYNDFAIGVVLSGTGADGALGLKAIKERGGITFAQGEDGSAPLFPEMPESALAAGVIDLHLPVEKIAQRLVGIVSSMHQKASPKTANENNDRLCKEICALLEVQVGHDFSGYKQSTFVRRVERRMSVLQLSTLEAYVACLRKTPSEVTLLFRDLLISVTSFFRDVESFDLLAKEVIPEIFHNKKNTDELRVWVPGCATGEEAFSIGMLLLECADALGRPGPTIRVFATDIDESALGIARKARYPEVLLDGVPLALREKYFIRDQDHYVVHKRLRDVCTFSAHNVLRDPPFSRIDLVSCRNLLIYLGQEFQDRILPILHYALRPDGFLFVGVAEGATRHSQLFSPISKKHRVFRRLDAVTGVLPLPLMTASNRHTAHRFATELSGASSTSLRKQIEARVLQAYMPAYVLINAQGEAVFYSAGTGRYLEFSPGAPSRHLLSNARKELRLSLRRSLHEAISNHARVTLPEIIVPRDDGLRKVHLVVEPFDGGPTPLYLVLFIDQGPAALTSDHQHSGVALSFDDLERELRDTRDQLQTTYEEFETAIEELRVANEELMSMNEELQSSNEELETSKEELQSVNEELQTVNAEMGRHVEALDLANADLQGLIESTGIATIFLDSKLAIRSYTQAATDIFTLIPSDRGRLITDLAHQLVDFDLERELNSTLVQRKTVQLSTTRRDGRKHYLTCLLPYSASTGDLAGVVMTFVDVTALTEADARHRVMIGELNHRVRNMLAVVTAIASQTLRGVSTTQGLEQFLDRLHAMARTYKLLTEANWSNMSLSDLLREELGAVTGTNRFEFDGPIIELDPKYSLAMGMVFHELTVNALKYGGLSNERGNVLVRWRVDGDRDVTIDWIESGGPLVAEPAHRGFGSALMDHQIAYELDARCDRAFKPEGLEVTIRFSFAGNPP